MPSIQNGAQDSRPDLIAGIGNPLLDVAAEVEEEFLAAAGLAKGAMRLSEEKEILALHEKITVAQQASGGALANTMAGIAVLGGGASFCGSVGDDESGRLLVADMENQGVQFCANGRKSGRATGRSLVLITPDGERTMATCLGAALDLSAAYVAAQTFARARFCYIENYVMDFSGGREAAEKAAAYARGNGGEVVFNLSDPLCAERNRAHIAPFIARSVDMLIANEREVCAFMRDDDFASASRSLSQLVRRAALTRSEKGSVIFAKGEGQNIAAEKTASVRDSTGAGDAYAAGLLYGLAQGFPFARAARLGSLCGAHIVGRLGARAKFPAGLAQQAAEGL